MKSYLNYILIFFTYKRKIKEYQMQQYSHFKLSLDLELVHPFKQCQYMDNSVVQKGRGLAACQQVLKIANSFKKMNIGKVIIERAFYKFAMGSTTFSTMLTSIIYH